MVWASDILPHGLFRDARVVIKLVPVVVRERVRARAHGVRAWRVWRVVGRACTRGVRTWWACVACVRLFVCSCACVLACALVLVCTLLGGLGSAFESALEGAFARFFENATHLMLGSGLAFTGATLRTCLQ